MDIPEEDGVEDDIDWLDIKRDEHSFLTEWFEGITMEMVEIEEFDV